MKMTATSEDGRRRPLRWWYGLIGLLVVAVVVGLFFRAPHAGTDPNDVLHGAIVRGIQGNVAKLFCAVLVWKSEDAYFGPWSDKPQGTGDHQLWWDGRRTAVSCTMRSTTQDPNGHVSSDLRARFMTYNGRDFRLTELPATPGEKAEVVILKRPRYRPAENYLTDVGWLGRGLISGICVERGFTEPGTLRYAHEGKLIKRDFHNSRTGQIGVWMYDPEKAYGLVNSDNYVQAGKIRSRTTIEYAQVAGGAWFPVRVVAEGYNIQTGELLHRSQMEVDVQKSVFNDPAAIPAEIFDLEIDPGTEVRDLTSLRTKVRMRINDM